MLECRSYYVALTLIPQSSQISHIDERTRQDYTQPVLARDDEPGPLRQKIPNRVRA